MATIDVSPPVQGRTPPRSTGCAHHVVMVVFGVLLLGLGLILAGMAAPLGAALTQQRDGGFLSSPTERYEVASYAITSQRLDVVLDDGLPGQARGPASATIMLRAAGATPGVDVFVGIGPKAEVDAYLSGVSHSELAELHFNPFRPDYDEVGGSRAPALPAEQDFWVVSAHGPGTQQIEMDLRTGDWSVVIMNANGSATVAVDLAAGVRSRFLAPVTWGTLIAGVVSLAAGVLLLVAGAAGLGRSSIRPAIDPLGANGRAPVPVGPAGAGPRSVHYPARLTGAVESHLSRWLWLVKWFLAIPHLVVLAFLGVAFVVTTVVAGLAILFTGRYPRALFDFNVGVLRWNWRVAFYATALGTDRYPPFTLARTDYPADFDVDYPERLSRGLVLVKSWLLAIPQLLIVGLFTGNLLWWSSRSDWTSYESAAGISLLGILGVVAGVLLLATAEYPRSLSDLITGINRWIYRVLTYVALLRDEYPPFHLDQGPDDPGPADVPIASADPEPVRTGI